MIKYYNVQTQQNLLNHDYTQNNHFQIGFDNCAFQPNGEIFYTNYTQASRYTSDFFTLTSNILSGLSDAKIVYTGTALNRTLIKLITENNFNIKIIHINVSGITPTCPVSTDQTIDVTTEDLNKIIDLFPGVKTFDIIFKLLPCYLGIENVIFDETPLEIYRFLSRGYNIPPNWGILEKKSSWFPFLWCLENKIKCYPTIFRYTPEIIQTTIETFDWNTFQQDFISTCEIYAGYDYPLWIKSVKNYNEHIIHEEFWTIPLFRLYLTLHNVYLDKNEYFFGDIK